MQPRLNAAEIHFCSPFSPVRRITNTRHENERTNASAIGMHKPIRKHHARTCVRTHAYAREVLLCGQHFKIVIIILVSVSISSFLLFVSIFCFLSFCPSFLFLSLSFSRFFQSLFQPHLSFQLPLKSPSYPLPLLIIAPLRLPSARDETLV